MQVYVRTLDSHNFLLFCHRVAPVEDPGHLTAVASHSPDVQVISGNLSAPRCHDGRQELLCAEAERGNGRMLTAQKGNAPVDAGVGHFAETRAPCQLYGTLVCGLHTPLIMQLSVKIARSDPHFPQFLLSRQVLTSPLIIPACLYF